MILTIMINNTTAQKVVFTEISELPETTKEINCIETFGDENVWVGTNNSLLRIKNGRVDKYKDPDNPSVFTVNNITTDKENTIWFGTYGSSIVKFNGSADESENISFMSYTNGDYELVSSMYSLDSCIWLGTSNGRVLYYNIYAETFDTLSLPVKSEIYSLYRDDKSVWVCTHKGLYYTDDMKNWKKIKGLEAAYKIIFHNNTYWIVGIDEENKTVLMFSDYNHSLIFGFDVKIKKWSILPIRGIDNNYVRFNDIDIDENGNIWVAFDKGIVKYDPYIDKFDQYNSDKYPEFKLSPIRNIKVQDNKTIWVSSFTKLVRIDL